MPRRQLPSVSPPSPRSIINVFFHHSGDDDADEDDAIPMCHHGGRPHNVFFFQRSECCPWFTIDPAAQKESCVCCDKVGYGHYSRVLHFWILQVWTPSIVSWGSTYPLRYRRTAEISESVWISSTALCIWRTPIYFQNGVNSAPPPQTNQTSQRPLIPDLTIWRFKVNQLSQKIFLLSLFFVWFGRIPPVWSLRNNKFSPSDKSKESSTYQYLFSQQNLLILRFRAQRKKNKKSLLALEVTLIVLIVLILIVTKDWNPRFPPPAADE